MQTKETYSDESNGFRAKSLCVDYIYYTWKTILKNRQEQRLTYACFIDAEKAFDQIDRNLMLYKLLLCGVTSRIYNI